MDAEESLLFFYNSFYLQDVHTWEMMVPMLCSEHREKEL